MPEDSTTTAFDYLLAAGALYSIVALGLSFWSRGRAIPWVAYSVIDLSLLAALTYTTGGAESPVRMLFLLVPLAGVISYSALYTAVVGGVSAAAYIGLSVAHSAFEADSDLAAAVPFSLLLGLATVAAVLPVHAVVRRTRERERLEEARAHLLEREQAARVRAERAEARASLLARAGALLGASLDYETTLWRVAWVAVPEVADGCAVDLIGEDGSLEYAGLAHSDPVKMELTKELRRRYPPGRGAPGGLPKVLETEEPELLAEVTEKLLAAAAQDETHLEMLRALGVRSALVAPMVTRGRTIGAITLVMTEPGRRFEPDDVELAEGLAQRAATAIENVRLFRERSDIARTLQSSLLPPSLPELPNLELAGRYHPAAAGVDVGGDFYDVFDTAESESALVIGDVCGKGAEAASLTALARHTLRTAAMHEGRPSRILGTLNEMILREGLDMQFCTVAYARLERGRGGARVTLSSGGHPPPLLLRADGRVEFLGVPGAVLGVFADPGLSDRTVELGPADALVFYTDGVTDAHAPEVVMTPPQLASLVGSCTGLAAGGIADRIEQAVLGAGDARDDIAILVVRVHGR